jgi:hypothetical protein
MSSSAIDFSSIGGQPVKPPVDFSSIGGKPVSSANTVMIGGKPVNLTSGAGGIEAAQGQNTAGFQEGMRQAHGAPALISRPTSSLAQDQAFDAALGAPTAPTHALYLSGPKPEVPKGMEDAAHIAESIPAVAGAMSGLPGTGALYSGVSKLIDMVPNAERAGQAFNAVKDVVGEHPVAMTDELSESLMRYRQLVDAGGSRSLAVEKLLQRATNPDKGPLTFNEARDFYSNISRLSADEAQRLTPVMRRQVGQIASDFGDAIANTAEQGGKLNQFQNAMKEYSRAMALRDAKSEAARNALKYGAGAAASALGGGVAGYGIKKVIESQAP